MNLRKEVKRQFREQPLGSNWYDWPMLSIAAMIGFVAGFWLVSWLFS